MTNRLRGLDALRGLAAMAVVLHHYTGRYPQVTGQPFPLSFSLVDGHYGVELFFIVSGCVILMTLERTPRLYDFVGSRLARLWPAYVACTVLTLAVLSIAAPPWYGRQGFSSIVKNLTMMPLLAGATPIDGSSWSLMYEIMFYGWAGIGFFLLGPRRTELWCGLWLAASLAWRGIGTERLPFTLQVITAVQFAPLFVIGIMIHRIRARESRAGAWALVAVALGLCLFGPDYSARPISGPGYVALIATFAFLVWEATGERSWLGRARPLVWLGEISYPLYLIHQNIGYVLLGKLRALGASPDLAVLLAIFVIVPVAYLLSRFFERPGQRAIKGLFARFRNQGGGGIAPSPGAPGPEQGPG